MNLNALPTGKTTSYVQAKALSTETCNKKDVRELNGDEL